MRRPLIAGVLLLVAACSTPPAPARTPDLPKAPAAAGVLEVLAREIDPGAQPPIWPQLPAEVRARVEADAPKDRTPPVRLDSARERLARWSLQVSSTEPDTLAPKLQRAFEGVYLAEPIALGPDQDESAREARALLWNFYNAFAATQPLLRSFDATWGRAAGTKLGTLMDSSELITSAGKPWSDHLAAQVLRVGVPASAIDDILWMYASRRAAKGDRPGSRALYTELVRRSQSTTGKVDWLRIAYAHVKLEEVRSASDAIAKAKAALAKDDAAGAASVRNAEAERDVLVRLLALPTQASTETSLMRFDLLVLLERPKEADAILEALRRERPRDARVRARMTLARVRQGEMTDHLVDDLRDPDLTDRNGEYWSMRAGAAGMAIAKTMPTSTSLAEVGLCAKELAKDQPGRAAVLTFLVDRISKVLDGKPDAASFVRALQASFDDAVALRGRFPTTPDADRLVLALAPFTDPAKGLEAVLVRPKTSRDDDAELYAQRANTVVTLAAYAGPTADLARVRAAVDEMPTLDADAEGTREALLGDLEALAATQRGDRSAWSRAQTRYEAAIKKTKADRARLDNNLGFIAGQKGDLARANQLFEASVQEKSGRVWVAALNRATSSDVGKEQQLAIVRRLAPPDATVPPMVNAWLAFLEPSPAASAAAANALVELDAPLSLHKVALHSKGLEAEGNFSLGLGLRAAKLSHTLAASAWATLWLVRPMPLTRAELEAKARGPADAAKKATPAKKALAPKK